MELKYMWIFLSDVCLVMGTFNFTWPNLTFPMLPFFGKPMPTSTASPIIIVNPLPPPQHTPQYGYPQYGGKYQNYYGHGHHHHGHYHQTEKPSPYTNVGHYLILEKTDIPYVNDNFLEHTIFQIQKINVSLAACVGSFRLKRNIQQSTLLTRLYSCTNDQCNHFLSEIPRQPLCNFIAGNQYNHDYTSNILQRSTSTSCAAPYSSTYYGCNLPQGLYQFVIYVPLNIVPQPVAGQRWRMDCYMASGGKRIATFALYAKCGTYGGNTIPYNSHHASFLTNKDVEPAIGMPIPIPSFERILSTTVSSDEYSDEIKDLFFNNNNN